MSDTVEIENMGAEWAPFGREGDKVEVNGHDATAYWCIVSVEDGVPVIFGHPIPAEATGIFYPGPGEFGRVRGSGFRVTVTVTENHAGAGGTGGTNTAIRNFASLAEAIASGDAVFWVDGRRYEIPPGETDPVQTYPGLT